MNLQKKQQGKVGPVLRAVDALFVYILEDLEVGVPILFKMNIFHLLFGSRPPLLLERGMEFSQLTPSKPN